MNVVVPNRWKKSRMTSRSSSSHPGRGFRNAPASFCAFANEPAWAMRPCALKATHSSPVCLRRATCSGTPREKFFFKSCIDCVVGAQYRLTAMLGEREPEVPSAKGVIANSTVLRLAHHGQSVGHFLGVGLAGHGKLDGEGGSLAGLRGDGDRSAVLGDDLAGDRQSQAGPA